MFVRSCERASFIDFVSVQFKKWWLHKDTVLNDHTLQMSFQKTVLRIDSKITWYTKGNELGKFHCRNRLSKLETFLLHIQFNDFCCHFDHTLTQCYHFVTLMMHNIHKLSIIRIIITNG